jgi:hypothetical protein
VFTAPLAKEVGPPALGTSPKSAPSVSGTVLVVDDNKLNRLAVVSYCKKHVRKKIPEFFKN